VTRADQVKPAPHCGFVVAEPELEQALTQVPAELRAAHGEHTLGEDMLKSHDYRPAPRRARPVEDPSSHGLVAAGRAVVLEGEPA
jgi:hypothetical protein